MSSREFLERRNALWRRLRDYSAAECSTGDGVPDAPEFEAALLELSGLIGWDRGRVLAGLGLGETRTVEDCP